MKVLLVNGSPHQNGCTFTALEECAKELNRLDIETEILWLGTKSIQGCIACAKCHKTGKCIFEDIVNEVSDRLEEFDGYIFGGPVYYGGPCGQLTSFMDRLFYSNASKMACKPASSVVSCRRGGATAAYDRLNKYYEMCNMPLVTSQYWNQIHGNNRQEALQDEEGLQTMRTLAVNMAWLLKSIDSGKKMGVEQPVYEPKKRTNFIR